MPTYRFRIDDPMNPWARSIDIEAIDQIEAEARAESYLFARRDVGEADGLVKLTPMER